MEPEQQRKNQIFEQSLQAGPKNKVDSEIIRLGGGNLPRPSKGQSSGAIDLDNDGPG